MRCARWVCQLPWAAVFYGVALLALAGGLLLFAAVPEKPRTAAQPGSLQWRALASIWTDRKVRASVLGYFGHMWELYTMLVLVPAILATRLALGPALSWQRSACWRWAPSAASAAAGGRGASAARAWQPGSWA